jgi:hypothetical protein
LLHIAFYSPADGYPLVFSKTLVLLLAQAPPVPPRVVPVVPHTEKASPAPSYGSQSVAGFFDAMGSQRLRD